MKFMVSWNVHPDKRVDIITTWCALTPEQRADVGEGVTLIGRWHNLAEHSGVALFATEDLSALMRYLGRWNPVMDLEVAPVLDDEESAAAGSRILADLSDG